MEKKEDRILLEFLGTTESEWDKMSYTRKVIDGAIDSAGGCLTHPLESGLRFFGGAGMTIAIIATVGILATPETAERVSWDTYGKLFMTSLALYSAGNLSTIARRLKR